MALANYSLAILNIIFNAVNEDDKVPKKILSLGYPDLLVNPSDLAQTFGTDIAKKLIFHPDSKAIAKWHNIESITTDIVESKHLFQLLGYELDVLDITQSRGDEIICDLNEPCPEELHGQYGIVIDSGTCEHCFNIAQAVKNLANMVSVGGYILQGNPLNMYNHGFYNLNPTWYFDAYTNNGFSIEHLEIIEDPVFNPKVYDVPSYQRFHQVPENASLIAIAKKDTQKEFRWPIQHKYQENPMLRG